MTTGADNAAIAGQLTPSAGATLDANGVHSGNGEVNGSTEPLSPKKRTRTNSQDVEASESSVKRVKGVAPIKAESVPP